MADGASDPFLDEGPIQRLKREVSNDVVRACTLLGLALARGTIERRREGRGYAYYLTSDPA